MNYITLSKTELKYIIKKAYMSGQNNNIQLANNMNVSHNLDEYVQNEIEQILKQQQTDEWLK
jgi:hypothetical protein